jgi:hypothetical protein
MNPAFEQLGLTMDDIAEHRLAYDEGECSATDVISGFLEEAEDQTGMLEALKSVYPDILEQAEEEGWVNPMGAEAGEAEDEDEDEDEAAAAEGDDELSVVDLLAKQQKQTQAKAKASTTDQAMPKTDVERIEEGRLAAPPPTRLC